MLSKTLGLGLRGVEGVLVDVEVDLSAGLPSYATVGLPDAMVRESKERVVSALRNSGFDFPPRRVTVNLAPAEIRKEGTHFDLPIAVGVLAASRQVSTGRWSKELGFVGELALDGSLRPVRGVLPMVMRARRQGLKGVVVPFANREEAAVTGLEILSPATLGELARYLNGQGTLPATRDGESAAKRAPDYKIDFSEVRGQALAKRALELAAAGAHNVLLAGPPGTGKSMLARRLPTILPPLSYEEALEATQIASVAGVRGGAGLVWERPFRAPHHNASAAALAGGGASPRPGEASLAHHGVLFLDELPEFHRDALEALRQPLEDGVVTVARAKDTLSFPAQFMLVAAMNPCPCGFLGHPEKPCLCTPVQVAKYRAKVSGPLLDRIDLHVAVGPVRFDEWAEPRPEEASEAVRRRVAEARGRQRERLGPAASTGRMTPSEIRRHCVLGTPERKALEGAMSRLGLSARSLDRILRVARTIADLQGAERIDRSHVVEAIQYRSLDRAGLEA